MLLQLPLFLSVSSISHYPLKQLTQPHRRSRVILQLPVFLPCSSVSHYPLKQVAQPHRRSRVLLQLPVLLFLFINQSLSNEIADSTTLKERRSSYSFRCFFPINLLDQSLSTKTGDSSTLKEQSALATINQSMSINQCSALR